MDTVLLVTAVTLNVVLLIGLITLLRRSSTPSVTLENLAKLPSQIGSLDVSISERLRSVTADMAGRLESTKGDLRQEVADRLTKGFREIHAAVEAQLAYGRREQNQQLLDSRAELTGALALTTSQLKVEFDGLNQKTAQSLESIRDRVDAKLLEITQQVQD